MDDYFFAARAIEVLELAEEQNMNSYTVNIILAIVTAQDYMEFSFCTVWKLAEAVQNNKALDNDMREEAVDIIFDYLKLYKSSCE